MPTWALAFGVALALALFTVARCRRLALAIGFVDVPDARKGHRNPVPYLGGVGLIVGVLGGLVLEYPIGSKVTLIALAATVLGTIGLVDDDRTVSPYYRFAAEAAAAAAATAAGLRIHATGVPLFDMLLTMVWIVGITNAMNLMDNMDGLAAGITAAASTGVFALAIAAGQPVIATLAAATAGACLGFLAFNRPPASIFMGDAGSLFLGFLIAVLSLDVDSALTAPRGFLVPLMLLGIPILDTTTVTLARLRRHRHVFIGGRDHLSHRLAARGLSPARSVAVLVGAEAVMAALAVLAGRQVLPLPWTVAAALAVVVTLAVRTAPVEVYLEPVLGFPRALKRGLLLVLVALPVLAAPAALALAQASRPARAGAAAAVEALRALERGDADAMAERFSRAQALLAEARDRLDGPVVAAGLAVPGVSSNLRAAQALVAIGHDLATQGALLADAYVAQSVTISGGAIPLDEIEALAPLLDDAHGLLRRSERRLADLETAFVVSPLTGAVNDARARLSSQTARTESVVQLARVLPAILGGEGTRRYFVAFQNNAELRGSGGFMGNWAELVAENGRLRIDRFGRMEELNEAAARQGPLRLDGMNEFLTRWREFNVPASWQQVNLSPDFPTTARVISQLYPQSGGRPVDGVIAIDPFGLAALLELTGPIVVPDWDAPISASNVVKVTLQEAYTDLPQELRVEFLGEVARRTAEALTTADIASPTRVGSALGTAAREEHVKMWLAKPEEQRLIKLLGADGAMPAITGDSLMLVHQNLGANKIDYYLRRSIYYDVRLTPSPDSSEAKLAGRVQVTLENTAPPSGLPAVVIGPYDSRFAAGENRAYLSLYTPFALRGASVNGTAVTPTTDPDLGRMSHSVTVSVPALHGITVDMEVAGDLDLSDDGWYRLDLLRQPAVNPDVLNASITVPDGWRIVEARNAELVGDHRAVVAAEQTRDQTVWLRVERTGLARIWDKLVHGG